MPQASTTPRPTPSIPAGGLFSPYASCSIHASALAIYNAILNTSTWTDWNTFVPSVTITHQPAPGPDTPTLTVGAAMTFKVHMTSTVTTISKELVTIVDAPPQEDHAAGTVTRICWAIDHKGMMLPSFLMHAERVNEIEQLADGTCTYRTWETFAGPVARVVRWKYESVLQARFEDWVRDLKAFVEEGKS